MGNFKARTLAREGRFVSFDPPTNNLSTASVLGSILSITKQIAWFSFAKYLREGCQGDRFQKNPEILANIP